MRFAICLYIHTILISGFLYIPNPDESQHYHDITSSEVKKTISELDQLIGILLVRIRQDSVLKNRLNLIILSDHGHINTVYPDNYIDLMDIISPDVWKKMTMNGWSLMPKEPIDVDELYSKLTAWKEEKNLKVTIWKKEDTPDRFHWKSNPRIGPISILPDPGFYVSYNWTDEGKPKVRGQHGYDNTVKEMRGIFIACGPAFKAGVVKPFENIHIYPAVNYILGLNHSSNGSLAVLKPFLIQDATESFVENLVSAAGLVPENATKNSLVVVFAVIFPSLALIMYFCMVLFTGRKNIAVSGGKGFSRQPLLLVSSDEEDHQV